MKLHLRQPANPERCEHEVVLQAAELEAGEAYRVLAPGGEFAFFIMPYRLIDGSSERRVTHRNALAHKVYARRADGGETGIPFCEFGVDYVREAFCAAGFAVEAVPVFDPLSCTSHRWFLAAKPHPS